MKEFGGEETSLESWKWGMEWDMEWFKCDGKFLILFLFFFLGEGVY